MQFNVTLSSVPYVTVAYMHTYDDNAGAVRITLAQDLRRHLSETPKYDFKKNLYRMPQSFAAEVTKDSSVDIDAYNPGVRFALITEFNVKPIKFHSGWAVLSISLLKNPSTGKGNRFKVVGVQSC